MKSGSGGIRTHNSRLISLRHLIIINPLYSIVSRFTQTAVLFQVEIDPLKLDCRMLIKKWRKEYNQVKPTSSLGYQSPTPAVIVPVLLI
jgi:hypothetical protein